MRTADGAGGTRLAEGPFRDRNGCVDSLNDLGDHRLVPLNLDQLLSVRAFLLAIALQRPLVVRESLPSGINGGGLFPRRERSSGARTG